MAIITALGMTGEAIMVKAYIAARAAGCPAGINSSYRDPKEQIILFHDNYTSDKANSAQYDPRRYNGVTYWRRKAKLSNGGKTVSVAVPGSSKHEKGYAMDLPGAKGDTRTARGWMHKHGPKFGIHWPQWAQESATYEDWHFEHDGKTVVQEDDMFSDSDRDKMDQIWKTVRPGKAGQYHDGDLAALVRASRNAAQAASDAAKAAQQAAQSAAEAAQSAVEAAQAAKGSADQALRADTKIPLTPMAQRIIKEATGKDRTTPVNFGDTAAYSQALAFAKDAEEN